MNWEDFKKAVKEDMSIDSEVICIKKDGYNLVFFKNGEVYEKRENYSLCIATERTPEQMLKIKEGLE